MSYSQELGHTRDYHHRIKLSDVQGCWRYISPTSQEQKSRPPQAAAPRYNPLEPWHEEEQWPAADAEEYSEEEAQDGVGGEDQDQDQNPAQNTGNNDGGVDDATRDSTPVSIPKVPKAVWTMDPDLKEPNFERVLLRFVFRDVGHTLYWAKNAKELLKAGRDCLGGARTFSVLALLDSD